MKKCLSVLLICLLLALSAGSVLANEKDYSEEEVYCESSDLDMELTKQKLYDYGPVIGEFRPDPTMLKLIEQLEELGENYYKAAINNNFKASLYLTEYFNIINEGSIRNYEDMALETLYRSWYILPVNQVPQQNNYYCGYAAMKSILDYKGVYRTQDQIASTVYRTTCPCPWFISPTGSSWSDFPVATNLTNWLSTTFVPFPYGPAGGTTITPYDVRWRVKLSVDSNKGALSCGLSRGTSPGHLSILPGYPAVDINHWITLKGYGINGNLIYVADPAKSPAVWFSKQISAYYWISDAKLAAYASNRGLIW